MNISEIFYSIQGEGIQIGLPTIFIRLTGCNLNCKWCDTKYARKGGRELAIPEILEKISKYQNKLVCVTGGEPLFQKDTTNLISKLIDKGYSVCLETNGSIYLGDLPFLNDIFVSMDIKGPSSGMAEKMNFDNIELLKSTDQLKFVIRDLTDYNYAKRLLIKYSPVSNLVFMPVWEPKWDRTLKLIVENILKDRITARVLLQLHKIIWKNKKEGI